MGRNTETRRYGDADEGGDTDREKTEKGRQKLALRHRDRETQSH